MTTIQEVIDLVDELKPNAISQEVKTEWLQQLETDLRTKVIDTHSSPPDLSEDSLCVAQPYQDIYRWYLEAMIDDAHGEVGKYNNSSAKYNAARLDWENHYNRTHGSATGRRRHFI